MKKVGFIVNPVAGIGGSVGLKGSDGIDIQEEAWKRGAIKKSGFKALECLKVLLQYEEEIVIYTAPGEMGESVLAELGIKAEIVGKVDFPSKASDTESIAAQIAKLGIDVFLFAGGDGTARNVCASIGETIPVIGIPAGVKIHSAVYATSPSAAGKALMACLQTKVSTRSAEVMDIDENEYRSGRLQAKLYGYMSVPILRGVIQNPKATSHNNVDDVGGICEEIKDRIKKEAEGQCFLFGAGSTVTSIEKELGLPGALLGIDAFLNGEMIGNDLREEDLLKITKQYPCKLIITVIGGQGHIFGRGNQQLSPQVIKQIGLDNIWVVATASKIYSLPDQSLYVDTSDVELDSQLRGYRRVIVGWQECLVCKVS